MFKNWFDFTQQLFRLTTDMAESKQKITELQKEIRDLTFAVQALRIQMESNEREARQREENIFLRVQNALLLAERSTIAPTSRQIETETNRGGNDQQQG